MYSKRAGAVDFSEPVLPPAAGVARGGGGGGGLFGVGTLGGTSRENRCVEYGGGGLRGGSSPSENRGLEEMSPASVDSGGKAGTDDCARVKKAIFSLKKAISGCFFRLFRSL